MPPGARRCLRAVIEYDGTAFAGSQVQPNARTVQGELEEALNRLTGERVRVRLAGRTDAGVHATGQVAAFCLPRRGRVATAELGDLRQRLNGVLPDDLAVRSLRVAAPGFDPRRDAVRRIYRYRVRPEGVHRPLDRHRTLEIDDRLDVAAMRAAAARLVGERDFAALGSDRHGRTVRHLAEVAVTRRGDLIEIRVTANAFLRRMVRSLVALLLEVGRGRLAPESVEAILAGGRRALHGQAAPPRGLTFERVIYNTNSRRQRAAARGGIGPNKVESESRRR
jgi:tRNA pseudouridine38-40 synthase